MNDLSNEIYENGKILFKEAHRKKFLIKILILFCIYLFSNYLFDSIEKEDLIKTFNDKPFITIRLPNNTTFKIIISIIMIIISHWVYNYGIKPILNRID
jgi:hypothetical protein